MAKLRPTDMYRLVGDFGVRRRSDQYKVLTDLFNTIEMSKELGKVNGKTLTLVGLDVRDAAKRGIGQTAPAKTKAGAKAVGADRLVDIRGGVYRNVNATLSGKPRPAGKPIKSWAPKRFVYRDILSTYDGMRGTVVIGPYRSPWLNELHQDGGTETQVAYIIGQTTARYAYQHRKRTGKLPRDENGRDLSGAVIWTHRRPPSRAWEPAGQTRTARFPARPFMAGSAQVDKAVEKANKWFRDTFYPRRAA